MNNVTNLTGALVAGLNSKLKESYWDAGGGNEQQIGGGDWGEGWKFEMMIWL